MNYYTKYNSNMGLITLVSDGKYLTHLYFETKKYSGLESYILNNDLDVFIKTKDWLNKYFNKEFTSIDELPILLNGTEFQLLVWNILKKIPNNKLITYKDIANKIAKKRNIKTMSAQAVGNAVGKNPIPLIIPCHRVIGSNNNLVGYSGGINIKIDLLKHEGFDLNKYSLPKKT